MWPFDIFFSPKKQEIDRATNFLVENFGEGAASEAVRLARVYRRLGSPANARLYRLVARNLSIPEVGPQAPVAATSAGGGGA